MNNFITLLSDLEAQTKLHVLPDLIREQQARIEEMTRPLREFNRLHDMVHDLRLPTIAAAVDSLRLNDFRDLGAGLRDVMDAGAEFRRMTEALQPPHGISSLLASIQPPVFSPEPWLSGDRLAGLDIPVSPRSRRVEELEEKVEILQAEVEALKAAITPLSRAE